MIKYGIGLTLLYMSKEEFLLLLDDYHQHIEYIYYSSLIDHRYYARILLDDELKRKFYHINPNDQYEILNYARSKYGIKTELTVNTNYGLSDKEFIKMIRLELKHHVPDKMVIHNRLANDIRKIDKNIILAYSYNNNLFTYDQITSISEDISEVVVGNRFIRDSKMYDVIKESRRTPICLVNNACSHNCGYCGSGTCDTTFLNNLCKYGINIPFSIATLYPWEVREIHNRMGVNLFKLSTRTFNYEESDYLLKIMINNVNEPQNNMDTEIFLKVLSPMYEWKSYYNYVDLTLVDNYKRALWSKI